MTLPEDCPEAFHGPRAWTAQDLRANESAWRARLTPDQVAVLERAADRYLGTGRDVGEITAQTFVVPELVGVFAAMRAALLHGVGVQVISGLPVTGYSPAKAAAIFCGIGAHLGSARSQNAAGHILGHVRDTGADPEDTATRIYQTSARQTFHTDSADCVGLLCLQDAMDGGASLLVSAETIYNRMRAARPDLLARLFEPLATDRRGEVPEGMKPFMTIPPLNWYEGALTVFYQRQYIDSAQRFAEAPRLTPAHVEALDMFDALANDPELHVAMQLVPGDMQFVHNHAMLHDRTGFVDWPDPARRRHLLRLWLSLPGDRALPPGFAQRYGSVEIGNRGGIITRQTRLHAPLD